MGLFVAFLAGTLSFLSPCVLPIVPAYIGRLAGLAKHESPLIHSLLFVSGFTLLFTLLGIGAAYAGGAVARILQIVQLPLGLAVVAGGLHLAGIIRVPALDRATGPLPIAARGRVGSMLLGIAFAAAWTPCIGIVLGAILALAATGSDPIGSIALLVSYSAGLGLPFIAISVAAQRVAGGGDRILGRLRRSSLNAARVGGLLVALIGLFIAGGMLPLLSRYLPGIPGL